MKIRKNSVVSLIYELRESGPDGRVIESMDAGKPMTFIFGSGRLLSHFEKNLDSLEADDSFNFLLSAGEAYGERLEDMIVNLPVSVFENDGRIDENICRIGNEVPLIDREGNRISGIINEITDSYVRMDFNHPMAGTDLWFSGRIIGVRDATPEELKSTLSGCSGCSESTIKNCSGCNP